MFKKVIKNVVKVSLAMLSTLLLFLFFSSESITFSVPNSILEFSKFMEAQKTFEIVLTDDSKGYDQHSDYEIYERDFSVNSDVVALCIKKYDTIEKAQEAYNILNHKNLIKMTFDIDGNSYIRFKIGEVNYCAWRNGKTVVVMKSTNKESLQMLKNYIVKQIM
ncbi:hypothetical protein [Fusibacter ferrireducens]|uniref:DUF4367 domain-containing protein n=1 Tax=Fusibacter ferrireducens TaxID=2785058 RepID=A0ABR9ZX13_9FIRM|nr:hypothetical protein [Fusibacter ferrireducens]MBF4694994.1 hypothetical protein [Fusibacter ferrireducens]